MEPMVIVSVVVLAVIVLFNLVLTFALIRRLYCAPKPAQEMVNR